MIIKPLIPVIFQADVTKSSGKRSVLTFVEQELEIPDLAPDQAPLAASKKILAGLGEQRVVGSSDYRVYRDRLFSCAYKSDGTLYGIDDLRDVQSTLAFAVEKILAKSASAQLMGVGTANTHPRNSIDVLNAVHRPTPWTPDPIELRESFLAAASGIRESTRVRNMAASSDDIGRASASAVSAARALASDRILVDGKLFAISSGSAVRVHWGDGRVHISDVDIDAIDHGIKPSWKTAPRDMNLPTDELHSAFFGLDDMAEAEEFALYIAKTTGYEIESRPSRLALYAAAADVQTYDMRYPELVRIARIVLHFTGYAITERLRLAPFSIYEDDPLIRHAFDRLNDVVSSVDPFAEPIKGVDEALAALLELIQDGGRTADAYFAKTPGLRARLVEAGEHVLGRWDERPMEIDFAPTQRSYAP